MGNLTTRSRRLPNFPVDAHRIALDITTPAEEKDEIELVQKWLQNQRPMGIGSRESVRVLTPDLEERVLQVLGWRARLRPHSHRWSSANARTRRN